MNYTYLNNEKGPKVIDEALKLLGIKEIAGPKHEKAILDWAKTLGLKNYKDDETAWCGLFAAIVVYRAGFEVVKDPLWADNWRKFGTKQKTAMKGDVLTFKRPGGNHVAFYVGEDDECYHVIGGNQSNKVGFTRMEKSRLTGIQRCPWKISQPDTVRQVFLSESGEISKNEA